MASLTLLADLVLIAGRKPTKNLPLRILAALDIRVHPFHPGIECIGQVKIGQKWTDDPALRRALRPILQGAIWPFERRSKPPPNEQLHPWNIRMKRHGPLNERVVQISLFELHFWNPHWLFVAHSTPDVDAMKPMYAIVCDVNEGRWAGEFIASLADKARFLRKYKEW